MALVTKIELQVKDAKAPHKETECVATIATSQQGERYLQLDTVGSADRKYAGKVSQSIQFSREAAVQLIDLIRRTWPEI